MESRSFVMLPSAQQLMPTCFPFFLCSFDLILYIYFFYIFLYFFHSLRRLSLSFSLLLLSNIFNRGREAGRGGEEIAVSGFQIDQFTDAFKSCRRQ